MIRYPAILLTVLSLTLATSAAISQDQALPPYATPQEVRLGDQTLHFPNGVPTQETVAAVYEQLDRQQAADAFINGYPAASLQALRQGFLQAGVNNNEVLVFSKLMDSKSLFLTANADTYYFWSFIDLSRGPMILEAPRNVLAVLDDMWFRWIGDVGVPGPDRGEGSKYLLVPPSYAGPLPEGGYFIRHSRTNRVCLLGRAFITQNPIEEVDKQVKAELKIYPYVPGAYGSSIGEFLNGGGILGQLKQPPTPRFVEGSGRVMNTIPPADASFFAMLHQAVQDEPAAALDPEIAGALEAIGIVKGKPFAPDTRMQGILRDAAAFANAAGRTLSFGFRKEEGFAYYADDPALQWSNSLFVSGYDFLAPPPRIDKDGVHSFPITGGRKLNARLAMFYVATGITPAMCMRLPGIGSQYLVTFTDAAGQPLDGGKNYSITLPKDIPAGLFWSLTLYDNQSRSMLVTSQLYPRAGSQSYPTPAAIPSADGSTTICIGPRKPSAASAGNFIETVPDKGYFVMLRLYSPKQSFFDKTWRPGNLVEVQ